MISLLYANKPQRIIEFRYDWKYVDQYCPLNGTCMCPVFGDTISEKYTVAVLLFILRMKKILNMFHICFLFVVDLLWIHYLLLYISKMVKQSVRSLHITKINIPTKYETLSMFQHIQISICYLKVCNRVYRFCLQLKSWFLKELYILFSLKTSRWLPWLIIKESLWMPFYFFIKCIVL